MTGSPSSTGADSANAGPVLELRGLTKVFQVGPTTVTAVDQVDLSARRGEIVLIMGPSGAGKTTLLAMIGGALRPTSGSVRILGREISSMTESNLTRIRRHQVGFIFQTFNLLESLSALENVLVPLNFAGVSGSAASERATGLLVNLGLESRLNFKPDELSGGERQRVSIARALANDPSLILADEPTGNLDSDQGHEVVALLRRIAKEQGRTVIIVSHDQGISDVADRVLRLRDGRFTTLQTQAG